MMRAWLVVPVLFASLALRPSPHRAIDSLTPMEEVARIQRHFDSVLVELRTVDVSHLSRDQRAAREGVIATLAAYRDRGRFPQNRDFPGLAVPYFIDRVTGVRCAVAHLMDATGAGALAERVAATNNNVWVAELSGNTAVAHWLSMNGLTLAEAARIQVPYVVDDSRAAQTFGSMDRAYAVGTAAVVLPATLATVWNARGNRDGHRRVGTVLGLASGALAVGFGVLSARDGQAPGYVAPVALVGGVVTTGMAFNSLFRHRTIVAEQRRASRLSTLQLAPVIAPRSGLGGVQLSMRF
jgi:hypothetical protein